MTGRNVKSRKEVMVTCANAIGQTGLEREEAVEEGEGWREWHGRTEAAPGFLVA